MIKDRTRVNETEQLSLDTLDSNSEQIKKDAFTIYSHLFFKDFFFDVNHFENLYIISYNNASVLCFFFHPQGVWDLNLQIRDRTCTPCTGM